MASREQPVTCATALERGLDDTWRAERDYVIAHMNGSAVFLFAALKMRLNMAVRRRRVDRDALTRIMR